MQKSTKTCLLTQKWRKILIFALKILFWLYMLKKASYGLLNIIFEKSIFRDQIHILGAKMNKHIFLNFWLKNEEKIWIFSLKIVRTSKHHFWKVSFSWSNPHLGAKLNKTCFLTQKWRKNPEFCIEIFWLYMLKKGSYGLLNIIFEKSIFGDQIHILVAKMNKHIFS